jgi:predicted nuclease with TOPRIM domain
MTNPQISTDLGKILEQINQKLDNVQKDMTDLKVSNARLEEKLSGQINSLDEKLSGQINTLDEKVTGFGKRLENLEFVNRSIVVALVVAILGGFAKLFGFIGNP